MKDRMQKQALGRVFGVVERDSILTGVPSTVPNLHKQLTCETCTVELKNGLPVRFSQYMNSKQKREFKKLTGYKEKKEG